MVAYHPFSALRIKKEGDCNFDSNKRDMTPDDFDHDFITDSNLSTVIISGKRFIKSFDIDL